MSTRRRYVLTICFFVGLVFLLSVFHYMVPISLSRDLTEVLMSTMLDLAGILIAVIGVLLAIYVSQGLKKTDKGANFRILLSFLTGSMCLSFLTSFIAFYSLTSSDVNQALPYLFLTLVYVNITTVTASVIDILR